MGAEREGIALKLAEGKVGGWLKGRKMRAVGHSFLKMAASPAMVMLSFRGARSANPESRSAYDL
jgi:hypothetical protein